MTRRLSRRMVVGGMASVTAATVLPVKASAQQLSITRKQIEIAADGGTFDAYLSAIETGKGPGVIMCSDIFGIHQGMKDLCDDLAQRGCVVVAQNFFWRDPQDAGVLPLPAGFQRAVARSGRIDFPKSMDDLRRSIAEVKRHPSHNGKVAVFGFCFGGPYAWRAACDGLSVDAAISFHGSFMSKFIKPEDKPSGQMSFHYGDSDELAPSQELVSVKKVADATGSKFFVHPGAKHAYMFRNNPQYHAEAAGKSWAHALQTIDALRS